MLGNNATLKIDFTDLKNWNFVRSIVGIMDPKWYTSIMNDRSTDNHYLD